MGAARLSAPGDCAATAAEPSRFWKLKARRIAAQRLQLEPKGIPSMYRTCILFLVSLTTACSQVPVTPRFSAEYTVRQRSCLAPPEIAPVEVLLDDITQGQVVVTVFDPDAKVTLASKSLPQSGFLSFHRGDTTVYVQVVRLRNFLMGDDNADILITTDKPRTKQQATEKSP